MPLVLTVLGVVLVAAWAMTRSSHVTEGDWRASAGADAESGAEASARLHGRCAAGASLGPESYDAGVPLEAAPEWLPDVVDLDDASQADAYLASLISEEPVDWTRVGDILAASSGPFSDVVSRRLLDGVTGEDRAAASRAIVRMRDGSLVACLLDLYDSGRLEDGTRAGVLGVLVELEGAAPDRIAEALAQRLAHEPRSDRELLNAIAGRGGAGAASILIEYLRWSEAQDPPRDVQMPSLDLVEDTAGRAVLLGELARESSPNVLEALLRMAGQPGAFAVAGALIEMDSVEMSEHLHRTRLTTLAEIGGDDVATYLLGRANRDDALAADAFWALGHLSTAGERGRDALREALAQSIDEPERPGEVSEPAGTGAPRGSLRAEQLLRVLGRLRDPYAGPLMGRCLTARSPRVRSAAVAGLGRLGREARRQTGALVAAYNDAAEDEVFRREVVRALGRVGGADVLDLLCRLQQAEDLPEVLREAVAAALEDARGS